MIVTREERERLGGANFWLPFRFASMEDYPTMSEVIEDEVTQLDDLVLQHLTYFIRC
jgi:hypothetical protein